MHSKNSWNPSSLDESSSGSAMNADENSDDPSQYPYYATYSQGFQNYSSVPTAHHAVGQSSSSLHSVNRMPQNAYPEQHDASSYYAPPAWPGPFSVQPYAPSSVASTPSPFRTQSQDSRATMPFEGYRAVDTSMMYYHPRPAAPAPSLPMWPDMPFMPATPYTEQPLLPRLISKAEGRRPFDSGAVALTKPLVKKKGKMHRCTICNHDFPRPSGLRTHMNSHNGIRPFPCTFPGCEKTFGVRSNMKRHLRTHGPPRRSADLDYWMAALEYPDSPASTPHDVQRPDSAIRSTQSWSPSQASLHEAGYSSSEYEEVDIASNASYSGKVNNVQLPRRNAMVPPSDSELELYNQKTATKSSFPFNR